jgi:ABC-type antimicrobial peptide transport system permease subunit
MLRPQTLEDQLSGAIAPRRFQAALFVAFAALGLVLAVVGTYGVLSYSVTQRTREIGLRMALGAMESNVLREVLNRGMKLALAGVASGIIGSAALAHLMRSLLYGVEPTDLWTYCIVALLLISVAMSAAYVPARRATRIDPMRALRYE